MVVQNNPKSSSHRAQGNASDNHKHRERRVYLLARAKAGAPLLKSLTLELLLCAKRKKVLTDMDVKKLRLRIVTAMDIVNDFAVLRKKYAHVFTKKTDLPPDVDLEVLGKKLAESVAQLSADGLLPNTDLVLASQGKHQDSSKSL